MNWAVKDALGFLLGSFATYSKARKARDHYQRIGIRCYMEAIK